MFYMYSFQDLFLNDISIKKTEGLIQSNKLKTFFFFIIFFKYHVVFAGFTNL